MLCVICCGTAARGVVMAHGAGSWVCAVWSEAAGDAGVSVSKANNAQRETKRTPHDREGFSFDRPLKRHKPHNATAHVLACMLQL